MAGSQPRTIYLWYNLNMEEVNNNESLFLKYCIAMANFYGRIPTTEAFEIIKKQNKKKSFSLDDFMSYLIAYQKQIEHDSDSIRYFFVYSDEEKFTPYNSVIVNECYSSDCYGLVPKEENEYLPLAIAQYIVHRYVPPKNELLKYYNEDYYEDPPELRAVVDWVHKHQCELPFKLEDEDIIVEVTLALIMESSEIQAMMDLDKWLDLPEDDAKRGELICELSELIYALYKNTRMWRLNGHKPCELEDVIDTELLLASFDGIVSLALDETELD